MNSIRRLTATLAAALILAPAPVEARKRKSEKLLAQGRLAEQAGDPEKALTFYEQALKEEPADIAYQLAAWRARFQASQARVDKGQKLRAEGKLEDALAEFQKALAINPALLIAEQEMRRTYQMIQREKQKGQPATKTPEEEAGRASTAADDARRETDALVASLQPVPELKPISRQIQSLRMNNQPIRVLYETVGKLAGINVIFDPEYQPPARQNHSVDLTNITLEEGLEQLAVLTKTYWKPLSSNTIFVTNDNVTKLREYQDHIVKVFYMRNVQTVQELNELSTLVRSITDIRRLLPYNAQNALIARGTVDQIALAEKILQDLDKPRAEVVIDVIVMEASSGRTRDLAAAIASASGSGFDERVLFTGGTAQPKSNGDGTGTTDTTTAAGLVRLGNLGKLTENDWAVTLPGAVLKAVMSDRSTKVRQSPQVRSVENSKTTLRIGDRVPTATGSFQPGFGVGGAGVSPLVNTQFQFIEVGVNVDIVPKVHGLDEVSLHVELEISNVRDRIDIGGIKQPVIGQRKVVHDIRIREGEISLLGGLLQDQDSRTVSGWPGLSSIPILGRLFSSESVDQSRSELLIALVPHIVRAPEITALNLRGVSAGNDQNIKLNYAPRPMQDETAAQAAPGEAKPAPAVPAEVKTAPAPPAPATPAPALPVEPKPAMPPIPGLTKPLTLPPGLLEPKPAEPKPSEPKPEPTAVAPPANVSFVPASADVRVSGALRVSLMVDGVTDLFSAPARVRFDPKLLRLVSVTPGTLLSGDGQKINFTENTQNDTGEAAVVLNRLPGSGGVSGSGSLVTFLFQAVSAGPASVQVTDLALRNSQLQPIPAAPPRLAVTIR